MARPRITPNQREVLYVQDTATGNAVPLTSTLGDLDVNAAVTLSGSVIPISGATTAVGVAIVDGSGNQVTSFGGGTQYADGAARGTATGTLAMVDDGTNIQSLAGNSSGELIAQAKQNGTWNITNVSGTISLPTGASTSANQTDGSQKTQVVDGSGNVVGSHNNRLDVTNVDQTASGSITSTQAVTISVSGMSTVGIQVTGSFTGTLSIQGSTDGSTYSPTTAVQLSNGTIYSSITGPFNGQSNVSGLQSFRILGNTVSVGTAVVTLVGSVGVSTVMLDNPLPTGSNVIGAVTQSGTWTVTANAGTNLNTSLLALESGGNLATVATNTTGLNNTVGTAASAIPSKLLQVGGSDGTNARAIKTDTSGNQLIAGTGTAGTAATGVVTVQGIASMTKLLVTPDANSAVNIAQLAGNTISSGVGTSGTGTLRTVVANDTGRTLLSASGSASSSGNNTIVAAGTNKLKVYAFTLSTTSTTAVTVKFQSGASGTDLWSVILQAPTSVSTGANLVVQPPAWLFATASATLLNLNLSSANAVQWSVSYFDEA